MSFYSMKDPGPWTVEESELTSEHLSLIGFAARLGTSIANDSHLVEDSEVRKEAELLMSLLSSTPTTKSLFCDEKDLKSGEDAPMKSPPRASSYRKKTFSFCCPSLSLKPAYGTSDSDRGTPPPVNVRKISDSDESFSSLTSIVGNVLTPADLFGRPLKVDDRDALRLSAEAMARNTLQSYEKAVAWRIQTWIHSVARLLVSKENIILKESSGDSNSKTKGTEKELKDLLETPEASLIKALQLAASEIEVVDAMTSFRVLPQKIVKKSVGKQPPKKRMRREQPKQGKSDYTVKHVLSFETVLNLNTPAGYTEVTLQAPGTIEGTFKSGMDGEETLQGINIEVDTEVLANTIERSTRIVVRCASEVCIQCADSEKEKPKAAAEKVQVQEESVPTPVVTAPTKNSNAAIVTPRYSTSSANDIKLEDTTGTAVPFPNLDGLDKQNPLIPMRMVSPQPNSPGMAPMLFTPRSSASSSPTFSKSSRPQTPTLNKTPKVPLLITPNPITRNVTYEGFLSPSLEVPSSPVTEAKKILPALVEVACAAMHDPN
eukprot:CAMPEP_0195291992 /NCGR_PEP_ID=MMETSP0707-20130614/8547_1 /TAXON_ID=33640 /ORGANISM="Asterionellopsis glacialis, Strain CCMP134" /LENGTH=544 /DNA_ID=CAMNT_0040352363 /DNA_START=92 /DNA_END=1726 /DNA_ORIENTATION=+